MIRKPTLFVLAGYGLLTLLLTWPTARYFTTVIPGDGFDGWQNYWNLWWIKESLLNRRSLFFFTDALYPPSGVSLLFHTLNYFNGLWTLPIQLNFGLTVAYNTVVVFHFVLAGFGVYLLARYTLAQLRLTGPTVAVSAFAAGVIFTFSPFHLAHLLGHLQVLSLTWVPFYILWLLKTLNAWRKNPTDSLSRRDPALCALFLSLTTMVDWYQTLYLLLFTALLLAWTLWRVWQDEKASPAVLLKPIIGLAAMGLAFGLIFLPLLVPMITEARTATYMRPGFEENVILSADLLAFFTPSELHPLWGKWVLPLSQQFTTTTSERLVFVGFVPLALALWAAVVYHRRRLVQFWLLFTATFGVLALGPYLHIAGKIVSIANTPISLPYLLLYKIVPFIGISRSLSRYDLMVMIGLGVLAAVGLSRVSRRRQIGLIALILFEFIAVPYPLSFVDTPAFFKTLAADPAPYTIAYLPMNWDRPVPLLYQTVHHKALLTAYTSRDNPLDLSWRTPVLQQWRTLSPDIIRTDPAEVAPTVLQDFGVKYVVLDYYQMPPGAERDQTEAWVAAALPNLPPVYHDDRLTVYQPPLPDNPRPYLQLGIGWEKLTVIDDQPVHLAQPTGTIIVRHPPSQSAQLLITTLPPHRLDSLTAAPFAVTITANGLTATVQLPPATDSITLNLPQPIPIGGLKLVLLP